MNWEEYLKLQAEVKASLGNTIARTVFTAPPLGPKPAHLVDQTQIKAEYAFPGLTSIEVHLPDHITLDVDVTYTSEWSITKGRIAAQEAWGVDHATFTTPQYVQRMLEGNPYGLYVEALKDHTQFWVRRGEDVVLKRYILEQDEHSAWLRYDPISEGTLQLRLGAHHTIGFLERHDLTPGQLDAILEGSSLMLIYDPGPDACKIVRRGSAEASIASAKADSPKWWGERGVSVKAGEPTALSEKALADAIESFRTGAAEFGSSIYEGPALFMDAPKLAEPVLMPEGATLNVSVAELYKQKPKAIKTPMKKFRRRS